MPVCLGLSWLAAAQQQPSQPQVKVNMLNVCSPSSEEQREIVSALARVPKQPLFGSDFEVDRGKSTLDVGPGFLQPGSGSQMSSDPGLASWVRIRREFSVQALFSTVQYSFSTDPKNMVETLVFRVRDPKDLMQLSIEDSASAVTSPATMLSTSTPASRIKLDVSARPRLFWPAVPPQPPARRRIRARTSLYFRARPQCCPTIAVCWERKPRCRKNWRGSMGRRRPSLLQSRSRW